MGNTRSDAPHIPSCTVPTVGQGSVPTPVWYTYTHTDLTGGTVGGAQPRGRLSAVYRRQERGLENFSNLLEVGGQ